MWQVITKKLKADQRKGRLWRLTQEGELQFSIGSDQWGANGWAKTWKDCNKSKGGRKAGCMVL